MSDRLCYRLYGWLAIINFALVLVPLFIAPIPPLAPGADLVGFIHLHNRALREANYLGVVQLPVQLLVLIFLAAVIRHFEESRRGWLWLLVLGSAVSLTTLAAVFGLFLIIGPFIASLGQAALAPLTQLWLFGGELSNSIQALMMGAVAVAILRLRSLPGWLGYLAWVVAALSGVGTLGMLFMHGPLAVTDTLALLIVGFSVPVWLLLLGIYWAMRAAAQPSVAAATV